MNLELERELGVLVVEPLRPLTAADFERMALLIDPFLGETGRLKGLMVDTRALPGWDGLGAMFAHEGFIRAHAGRVDRVALVTDSEIAAIVARIADYALPPHVRRFAYAERRAAMDWLCEDAEAG